MISRKQEEVDNKKVKGQKIPNRIEDMSPLPQASPNKQRIKYDYSPDFGLKINNSL